MAELTGGRLHLAHLTTAGAVPLLRQARERGVNVTAEVCPHHLTITDKWVLGNMGVESGGASTKAYDTSTKVYPPLRGGRDVEVLIEGLALAAFHGLRDMSKNPLAASINAYVMQDEARHVAFGRLALRDYYPELSAHEMAEREEFLIEGCWHMRDRFTSNELWDVVGLPAKECIEWVEASESMRLFRTRLFSRIVPIVRDIGMWSDNVQLAFEKMGLLEFCDPHLDLDKLLESDEKVAEEFDAKAHVTQTIQAAE